MIALFTIKIKRLACGLLQVTSFLSQLYRHLLNLILHEKAPPSLVSQNSLSLESVLYKGIKFLYYRKRFVTPGIHTGLAPPGHRQSHTGLPGSTQSLSLCCVCHFQITVQICPTHSQLSCCTHFKRFFSLG